MNISWKAMVAIATLMTAAASALEGLNGEIYRHAAAPNVFRQTERTGFEGSCGLVGADCRTIPVQSRGIDDGKSAGIGEDRTIAPGAIMASVMHENAFDGSRPAKSAVGAMMANPDDGAGAEGSTRPASISQGFGIAASAIGDANTGPFPQTGPIRDTADVSAPVRSCSMPRAVVDTDFFENSVAGVVGANLLPRPADVRAEEHSVDQVQVVAGACAMRIDP